MLQLCAWILPVGDWEEQIVLLQCLNFAAGLRVQSDVATPCVVQQLLFGRVELADLGQLLWSHKEKLCDGGCGGHCITVHTMDLEGLGHVLQPLVRHQNLLIAEQYPSSIFHCKGKRATETHRHIELKIGALPLVEQAVFPL